MDYLPPVVWDIKEFKEICGTEQSLLNAFGEGCKKVRSQMSVYLADAYGLAWYERIFDLPSEGTLNERRERICNKMQGGALCVYKEVQKHFPGIDAIYSFNSENFVLRVSIDALHEYCLAELQSLLESLVPCNVALEYHVRYNTHGALGAYTHGELSGFTHHALRLGAVSHE